MSVIQSQFAKNAALLILKMNEPPYSCTLGEAWRPPEMAAIYAKDGRGIKNSLHIKRLAVDLMLFKDGVWCTDGESYRPFGEYWKTLNSLNRFGGDFARKDWVHFEMQEGA